MATVDTATLAAILKETYNSDGFLASVAGARVPFWSPPRMTEPGRSVSAAPLALGAVAMAFAWFTERKRLVSRANQ